MTTVKKLLLVNTRWGTTANAQPWDPTIVTGLCAGARAFWSEVSFGQIDLQCTAVARFIQVSDDGSQATSSAGGILQIQGPPQLAAIGYDTSQYDWVYYLTPMTYGYDFPGWIQYGDPELQWKFIHEIGHHFGFQHVGRVSGGYSLSGADVHITGMLGWSQTGGTTSPMGYSHRITGLNAGEKIGLGLIPFATWDGQDRTYSLTPLNQPGGALYAVRVPSRPRGYIVERRELIGVDGALPGTGLVVHYDLMMGQMPPYGIQVPGSDNGTEVMGLWGTLTDPEAGIAIQYAGDGKVRVYNPGSPAPVPPQPSPTPTPAPGPSGATTMPLSQTQLDALKAASTQFQTIVAGLVADGGTTTTTTGGGTQSAASVTDAAGNVWTFGGASPRPPNMMILRNGVNAGGGYAVSFVAASAPGNVDVVNSFGETWRWNGSTWARIA